MNGSLDCLIIGLIANAAGQLDVLRDSLINLRKRAAEIMIDNNRKDVDNSTYSNLLHREENHEVLEEEIYNEIKECN